MKRLVCLGPPAPPPRLAAEVLTPNPNAARRLGVGFKSLDGLAREVVGPERVLSELEAHLLLKEAVREVLDPPDPAGYAVRLLPVVREVLRAGGDEGALLQTPRGALVGRVLQAYRARVAGEGRLDPAEVMWAASRRIEPCLELTVWGYPRLGRDDLAFLDAVADAGSVLYLPAGADPAFAVNDASARALAGAGWEVRPADPALPPPTPALQALVFPTAEAEVRWALGEAARLLEGGAAPEEVALVARDDAAWGPLVRAVAEEYGLRVSLPFEVPLSDTPLGAWLAELLRAWASGWRYEATLRLLAHRLGPGLGREQLEAARATLPRGEAWAALGLSLPALPGRLARAEWAAALRRLCEGWGVGARCEGEPRQRAAWGRFGQGLERWALGSAGEVTLGPDEALAELQGLLRLQTTPYHPDREGVPLHTPLALFGASFEHLYVLGLAEGVFPAPPREDPDLDARERERLGLLGLPLELPAEAARRERLSFRMLLHAARASLTLSYARLDGHKEQLPSPFFDELGLSPRFVAAPPPRSLEERREASLADPAYREAEGEALAGARHALEVERSREQGRSFDRYDGLVGPVEHRERRFSVSELNELLACGFRWMAARLWGLREEAEGEDPTLRGRLFHAALDLAHRRALGAADPRQAVLGCLEEVWEEAERRELRHAPPAWPARRRQYLQQLRQAVLAADFVAEGARIVASERGFEGEWQGFAVRGRLDRVDRGPGGLRLVDYKSSPYSVPGEDVQLLIYRDVALPLLFPGEPLEAAAYFFYNSGSSRALKPDADGAELAQKLRRRLERGWLHPVDGPGCRRCAFEIACRHGPRLEGKEAPA